MALLGDRSWVTLAARPPGVGCVESAKTHRHQIDRVGSDLRGQTEHFRRQGSNPITLGIVGINHADRDTSYEGDRAFATIGRGGHPHPVQEAPKARARLEHDALPSFDEFISLEFKATDEPPYPFSWLDEGRTAAEYGAILTRISRKYDARF